MKIYDKENKNMERTFITSYRRVNQYEQISVSSIPLAQKTNGLQCNATSTYSFHVRFSIFQTHIRRFKPRLIVFLHETIL